MEISRDVGPIDQNTVAYLQDVIADRNPEGLAAVVLLFDRQPPRVYHRPTATVTDMGPGDANDTMVLPGEPPHELIRADSISATTFREQAQICRWVSINGRHTVFCG